MFFYWFGVASFSVVVLIALAVCGRWRFEKHRRETCRLCANCGAWTKGLVDHCGVCRRSFATGVFDASIVREPRDVVQLLRGRITGASIDLERADAQLILQTETGFEVRLGVTSIEMEQLWTRR